MFKRVILYLFTVYVMLYPFDNNFDIFMLTNKQSIFLDQISHTNNVHINYNVRFAKIIVLLVIIIISHEMAKDKYIFFNLKFLNSIIFI